MSQPPLGLAALAWSEVATPVVSVAPPAGAVSDTVGTSHTRTWTGTEVAVMP